MARLNELPVSTDTLETLRKKFLRQNRDIARINSNQSLRIRQLENECARLLSENLEIRARNLELEKQVEDNSARRIADHALEIKAKMEAQLAQWGELLAGLGVEPPTKRRMHGDRNMEKPKLSTVRSPARRRPRNVAQDDEAQAMQEGRLPPINENKTYPRQTLNGEEILALCSEADTSTDSPDLGPPPVSRFVEEDPVKVDSPCKATSIPDEATVRVGDVPSLAVPEKGPIKLDYTRQTATEPKKASSDTVPPLDAMRPSLKAGSKRKFALKDEDDYTTSSTISHTPRVTKEIKPLAVRDIKNRKVIREMAAVRRDAREQPATTPILAAAARKPLAAKSTNDDVSSPKKTTKAATQDPVAAAKLDIAKEAAKEKSRVTPIPISVPTPPPATVSIIPEPATASPDIAIACPNTPEPPQAKDSTRDTPPPTDITEQGEISRPGRRARPSISYAEPNLRDKMRRPTKELVDAVSGEGKYVRRTSTTHQVAPLSSAKVEPEAKSAEAWKHLPTKEAAISHESSRRESVLSPLAEKNDAARTAVVADKKKQASITGDVSGTAESRKEASTSDSQEPNKADVIVVGHGEEHDPYEFTSTSPVGESKGPQPALPRKTRAPKGSRRSSTAVLRDEQPLARDGRPPRHAGARKRASMAAPKTASIYDFEDPEDSPFESSTESGAGAGKSGAGGVISAQDRVSRRRSMML